MTSTLQWSMLSKMMRSGCGVLPSRRYGLGIEAFISAQGADEPPDAQELLPSLGHRLLMLGVDDHATKVDAAFRVGTAR